MNGFIYLNSNTLHISLYTIASLGTLFIGLMLALLLIFAKRVDRRSNLFLGLALAVIVLKTGGPTPLLLPALGALLYFYVRQSTCPEQKFYRKDVLHFCPLLAAYWIPVWLVLISVIIYLYRSHRLIQDFYRRLRPVLMDRPRFAFRRLEGALTLLGLFCILWVFDDAFSFAIALVLIGMAVDVMLKTDTSVQLTMPITDRSDARDKGRRLKEAVAINRFYEDAELTLTTLAAKLMMHPHDLSRIINVGLEKNFNDFINEFRVREVARKMQSADFDQLTLLGIAYESGFNSQRTFNRVFKEMTGRTPVEYKNGLKKELPIDKLATLPRIRPVILRPESPPTWAPGKLNRNYMFRNYLKIALRQLRKQKMYAAIKVGGFALSIAACLLIALYIRNELSYDKSYPGADRIYRVLVVYTNNGTVGKGPEWPAPLAKTLKSEFAQVELSGRLMPAGAAEVHKAGQVENSYEEGIAFADQSMLDILKLPVVYGDRAHALTHPHTVVISKRKADKYFPGQDPVGKMLYFNDDKKNPYTIGAVFGNFPATSHLQYDFIATLSGMEFWKGEQNNWRAFNYHTYVLLKAGTNTKDLQQRMTADMVKNYFLPSIKKDGVKNPEQEAGKIGMVLQPITDINLYSYDVRDGLIHGDIRFIWLFGGVAAFILVIACINFVNLATAKSAGRAKEVGLRKVVGSQRSGLISQFLTESLLYSGLSFIIGLLLAWLLLPYFNTLASKSLTMPWDEWWLLPVILVSAFIIGIVAGIYPAFYLSAFKPAQVLKGTLSTGSKGSVLRNSLVVFQFSASIILIIGTSVIYKQMHYLLNKKVGFDKDQVVILQGTGTLDNNNIKSLKNELSGLASVKSVSISDYLPITGTNRNGNPFFIDGRSKLDAEVDAQFWQIDDTYLKTLGMKLAEGRNFSYAMADDTAGKTVIINQTLAKKLNLKHPIGARITNGSTFTVIGVVEDFNFNSMHEQIEPVALHLGISPSMITVKVSGTDIKNTLQSITATWKQFAPNQPIRYTFLDESFAKMYADVQRMGHIFTTFAILAIVIACLGLFALSAFMAEQRSKEIGIRKVLGASVNGITRLLSVDFVKLVALSILIASPAAWWAMNKWLQGFAYHEPVQWWILVGAGLAAILIALITVSFQAIKAAIANPVKSLRSE